MQVSKKTPNLPEGEALYCFSTFAHKGDNQPEPVSLTWRQLCELLRKRYYRENKDGRLFSGASFRPGTTRANSNVESVSLAILEFDGGATLEEVEEFISALNQRAGAKAYVYTTFSHTPDTPKFRVVLPLLSPVEGREWPSIWKRLLIVTQERNDTTVGDASRMHYLPACSQKNKGFAMAFSIEGAPLDVTLLPEPPPESSKSKATKESKKANSDPYATKVFNNELARVCVATEGSRNVTLNRAALALGKLVGAKRLSRSEAESALLNAARGIGLTEEESIKTIASGLNSGEIEPNYEGLYATNKSATKEQTKGNQKQVSASQIPEPALRTDKGAPEYAPRQLVELLRPEWESSALNTQGAMSKRISEKLHDSLRYVPALSWLSWDGKTWSIDDKGNTSAMAHVLSLSADVRAEAASLYNCASTLATAARPGDAEAMGKAAGQHLKHARDCEQFKFAQGALSFAAGNARLRATVEQFDARPYLLGFQNGVWDRGTWREHRREDYLLNLCPVSYDFNADRQEWEAILERMVGGDAKFARTLQHICGYVLSGAPNLRTLPWLYGPPGTGKSTIADLLQTVLGEQSSQIDNKDLDGSDAKERLGAKLWNRRLAVSSEAGNKKLDSEILKTLSGSDRFQVRKLYAEQFTALPRHVLMMVANDPPKLNAYDAALKQRVVALPFNTALSLGGPIELSSSTHPTDATLEDARQDPHSALVAGFTAWAMDGLLHIFTNQTIERAPVVEAATAQFWKDTDTLTPFWDSLEEDFVMRFNEGITKRELRIAYETWCDVEGASAVHRQTFTRGCEAFGLKECKLYRGKGDQPHGWRFTTPRRPSA